METMSLKGKVALVTGSSRGIGKAIVRRFAREGAKVVVTCFTDAECAAGVCEEIIKEGGEGMVLSIDVTDRASVRKVLDAIVKRWGGLDILVNNVGFLSQKPFDTITDEEWDHTLAANLKSTFICTQEASKLLRERRGSIINLSSVGGQTGGIKAPHYAAAKAGVISFTRSSAKLLAPEVRVNAIAPGFIRTDMYKDIISRTPEAEIISQIPLGRAGEPDDVARAAVFLASDEARYITGHVLNVNGGVFLG